MDPIKKLGIYVGILFAIVTVGWIWLMVSFFINPTWTIQFMAKYGIVGMVIFVIIVASFLAYNIGLFKAIRIYFINEYTGGLTLAGIAFTEPQEVPVKLLFQERYYDRIPDTKITLIQMSRIFGGSSILMPIATERGMPWSAVVTGEYLKTIHGKRIGLDGFLARVFGLAPETNPNDGLKLKELLKYVDADIAKKFIYIAPYGSVNDIEDVLNTVKNPADAVSKLDALEKISRKYEFMIWQILNLMKKIMGGLQSFNEEMFDAQLKTMISNIRSQTNPIVTLGLLSGVSPDKVLRTAIPQMAESAPTMGEAGELLFRQLHDSARRAGFELIPQPEFRRLLEEDKLVKQMVTGLVVKREEKAEEEEIERAEGE